MMHEHCIAQHYWAEGVNIASYIMNKVYLRLFTNKPAYEMYKGRKPNLSYFHFFGSTCYIRKNQKDMVGEFDSRVGKGIFHGYSLNSKAYGVYNKRTLEVEVSTNI